MTECFGYKFSNEELEKFFFEQEVPYRDYKSSLKEFQHYAKKDNSYNTENKTIVLYAPKYRELAEEIARIKREALDEDDLEDIEYCESEGVLGYDSSVHSGFAMMKLATWWAVKATDEAMEAVVSRSHGEEKEAFRRITELVREFRNSTKE